MAALEGTRAARYDLVTAGHLFMLAALPLRHLDSREALSTFGEAARGCRLTSPDRDAVLLHLLGALEPHSGGRLPSLVDRFLALRAQTPDGLRRFERCVEDVLRYRGIGNPHVQQAIAIIHERYATHSLKESTIAEAVDLSASGLCVAFKAQTGRTTMEYLRRVRLDNGARMLVESNRGIKEVAWGVGYQQHANFCHDFKEHVGLTPTEYRARGIRTVPPIPGTPATSSGVATGPAGGRRVLVMDDHQSTRDTLGFRLRRGGYTVDLAAAGAEAIERALTTRPDVIVLDVHLPDLDGFDCLRELRRRRPGHRPPVVLFTADWEVDDQAPEAHALGATIVSKLCDLEDVERVIASLCATPIPNP